MSRLVIKYKPMYLDTKPNCSNFIDRVNFAHRKPHPQQLRMTQYTRHQPSQFVFCFVPADWMSRDAVKEHMLNKLHQRCFFIISQYRFAFNGLLPISKITFFCKCCKKLYHFEYLPTSFGTPTWLENWRSPLTLAHAFQVDLPCQQSVAIHFNAFSSPGLLKNLFFIIKFHPFHKLYIVSTKNDMIHLL